MSMSPSRVHVLRFLGAGQRVITPHGRPSCRPIAIHYPSSLQAQFQESPMRRIILPLAITLWLPVFHSTLRADDDTKTVQMIEKLGGTVTRDDKKEGKPVTKGELRQTAVNDDNRSE